MSFGLLGKKLGQTRVYDAQGVLHSVTIVLAGPNRVLQCKTKATDGYDAVQLGFGEQKDQRLSKAKLGHLKKFGVDTKRAGEKTPAVLTGVQRIREFRNFSKPVKTGDLIGPGLFAVGDFVDAIGITKGRGFAGVVRRHDFRGGDSTHGAKGWHRRPGGIGQSATPGTVRRGARLPGHMGSCAARCRISKSSRCARRITSCSSRAPSPAPMGTMSSFVNPRRFPRVR